MSNYDFENGARMITEFCLDAATDVKKALNEAADELVADLKRRSPKRTGEYAKNWAKRKKEKSGTMEITVYNKAPTYRVAHLNEKGAIRAKRGVMPARPHIAPAFNEMEVKLTTKLNLGG